MIPKIIHLCWISGDKYPPTIEKCIKSWEKYLNEYEIIVWNKEKALSVESIWVNQAIENKKYAFAADYIRLYALYNFGGIYLDSDVEVLKSFNPLLEEKMFIGLDFNDYLEPAIIGAEKQHEWIGQLLKYYENRQFIKENGKFDLRPLPDIFVESALKIFKFKPSDKIERITNPKISIYPYQYFSPKNEYSNSVTTTKECYSIHHFESSWVNKGISYKIKKKIHIFLIIFFGRKFHHNAIKYFRKPKKS